MRRFEEDDTPAALTELLDWIEENTGLMGEDTPGDARFYCGGHTVHVSPNRNGFDHQSLILQRIEDDDRLRIKSISVKKSLARGEEYPALDVTTR